MANKFPVDTISVKVEVICKMGLKPGEKIVKIGGPIRIVDVRREPLGRLTKDIGYGLDECVKEGFEDHPEKRWPSCFVDFYCRAFKYTPEKELTRIEFEYQEAP